MAHRNLLSG